MRYLAPGMARAVSSGFGFGSASLVPYPRTAKCDWQTPLLSGYTLKSPSGTLDASVVMAGPLPLQASMTHPDSQTPTEVYQPKRLHTSPGRLPALHVLSTHRGKALAAGRQETWPGHGGPGSISPTELLGD